MEVTDLILLEAPVMKGSEFDAMLQQKIAMLERVTMTASVLAAHDVLMLLLCSAFAVPKLL